MSDLTNLVLQTSVAASGEFNKAKQAGEIDIALLLADMLAHAIKGDSVDMFYLLKSEMQSMFSLGFHRGSEWQSERKSDQHA